MALLVVPFLCPTKLKVTYTLGRGQFFSVILGEYHESLLTINRAKSPTLKKHCVIYENVQVKTNASQPNLFQSLHLKVSKFMKSFFIPKY